MEAGYQSLLDAAFPAQIDSAVVRGIQEGILLADAIIGSEPFLKTLVGSDLRGHLRRAGVLFRLHGMAMAGDLPFESHMGKMPKGGWHFVEIKSGSLKAHVCRSDGPSMFPEDTPIRQDERLANQGDLFRKPTAIEDVLDRYVWLTFGVVDSGAVAHVCWSMPSAKADVWLARTNVTRRLAEKADEIRSERPSSVVKLKFRKHIEEALVESDKDRSTER